MVSLMIKLHFFLKYPSTNFRSVSVILVSEKMFNIKTLWLVCVIFINRLNGAVIMSTEVCNGIPPGVYRETVDIGQTPNSVRCPNINTLACCEIYPRVNRDALMPLVPFSTVGYTNVQIIFDVKTGMICIFNI